MRSDSYIEYISIAISVVAFLVQGLNYLLYLRIKNAILENNQSLRRETDEVYVRKETFHEAVQRLECYRR